MFKESDIIEAQRSRESLDKFLQRNDVQNMILYQARKYGKIYNLPEGDLVTSGMLGVQEAVEKYERARGEVVRLVRNSIIYAIRKQKNVEKTSVPIFSLNEPIGGEDGICGIDIVEGRPSDEIIKNKKTILDWLRNDIDKKIFLALQENLEEDEILKTFQCSRKDIEKVKRLCLYVLAENPSISLREAQAKLASKKGLLVEDDEYFAKSLIEDFLKIDVDIVWKIYADDAAHLLASSEDMGNFDFILIDIVLPRYEGGEPTQAAGEDLLNVIQSNPQVPPGVILSSLLSLYAKHTHDDAPRAFKYLYSLVSRGFRPLPKKPKWGMGGWNER